MVVLSSIEREYRRKGFAPIPRLLDLDSPALSQLRDECTRLRVAAEAAGRSLDDDDCMLEVWPDSLPAEARRCTDAYFEQRSADSSLDPKDSELRHLLTVLLPTIAGTILGGGDVWRPCLFNEHYVVKEPGAGPFVWHTDAAHQLEALFALGTDPMTPCVRNQTLSGAAIARAFSAQSSHTLCPAAGRNRALEYVSFWVALDDASPTNGCLRLLPLDAPQPPAAWYQPADAACVRWLEGAGQEHIELGCLPAGGAIVFSSRLWHSSLPNSSCCNRRAFYAQYSREAIGGLASPLSLAVPTAAPSRSPASQPATSVHAGGGGIGGVTVNAQSRTEHTDTPARKRPRDSSEEQSTHSP